MSRPHKVEELLDAEEMEQLRGWLAERRRTVDETHEWLLSCGYTLSRGAVGNWLQRWHEERVRERMAGSGELARAVIDSAREGGATGVVDAGLLQLGQVLFEQTLRLQADGEIEPSKLWDYARSLKATAQAKQVVERLRDEYEAKQRSALEAARKTADAGGSATAVIGKVREILGIRDATAGGGGT